MSHASEQHFYKTSSLHIETRPPLQRSQERTAADFTGLLDLLAKIIAIDFEDLQKPVTFTESDPKDNNAKDIPLPIITMKLIKEFMIIYQGMIMAHGVQQMIFLSQESDETVRRSEGASEIHVRPVQYMIVFDELVPQSVARLREVIIKTGISDKLGGTENETILTDIGGIDRSPIVPAP